ncbi:transcriptional regulator, LysR family [Pseudogulbenkiania sp. NH8B]|uniref:LysR substrate-binding domain-containing protein n=1 Tax=Pseudogulbenkiania sp. (strain NH8B) TaxID=748280 RepID=UPI0002279D20|nr:LysR substrate-binding domain-containing protein [Pseudogulbenkiania sp. NH8B]BAK77663.1 transcriptional regulator, LysR family [Pseudogulbenkiania sp. NH8B]
MRLDFIDLKLFTALAESGSLTEAAERFPMALSAASQRLKKLEDLYGVQLVERHSRGIALTHAGDVLLHHARRLLLGSEQLNGDMGRLSQGVRREIRLMANSVASNEFLPDLLGRFLAAQPELDVVLAERPSRDIVTAIEDGEADIGILDGSLGVERLPLLPFARDRLVVICGPAHPLHGTASVAFATLLDHAFVGLTETSAMQGFVESMARRKGKALRLRLRVSSFAAVATLVGRNAGLAILPARSARSLAQSHALHVVELTDPWAIRELQLCVKDIDSLPAQARLLLDALLSADHGEPASD